MDCTKKNTKNILNFKKKGLQNLFFSCIVNIAVA